MGKDTTLYISNLLPETRAKDISDLFDKYGKLIRCDIPSPGRGYEFSISSITSTLYLLEKYPFDSVLFF
jgi:hypothetical protein